MKVILLSDVKSLGHKGDVVEVAEGYARNYLIPKGLAKEATAGSLRELQAIKEKQQAREKEQLEQAKQLAAKLHGQAVRITSKAGDKGRLFGSVTNKEVAEAIAAQFQVDIDRRKIELKEAIKALGEYPVKVRIHPQVTADMIVRVVGE
ncbi:MAG TPA: 50S ribosomal protein L9 [Clostridia bacterium]|nr:50S ribosomal protein L9 [Clostridia bacterium]